MLKVQILEFHRRIMAWHRSNDQPTAGCHTGTGPALATALVASVVEPKAFWSGRNFSAWIGLVPKQHATTWSRPHMAQACLVHPPNGSLKRSPNHSRKGARMFANCRAISLSRGTQSSLPHIIIRTM
jgi:transposase